MYNFDVKFAICICSNGIWDPKKKKYVHKTSSLDDHLHNKLKLKILKTSTKLKYVSSHYF